MTSTHSHSDARSAFFSPQRDLEVGQELANDANDGRWEKAAGSIHNFASIMTQSQIFPHVIRDVDTRSKSQSTQCEASILEKEDLRYWLARVNLFYLLEPRGIEIDPIRETVDEGKTLVEE